MIEKQLTCTQFALQQIQVISVSYYANKLLQQINYYQTRKCNQHQNAIQFHIFFFQSNYLSVNQLNYVNEFIIFLIQLHFDSNKQHTICHQVIIKLIIQLKNIIENMKKSSKFSDIGKSNCSTPAPLKKRISLELVNPTNEQFAQNGETEIIIQKKKTVTFFQDIKSSNSMQPIQPVDCKTDHSSISNSVSSASKSNTSCEDFLQSDIIKNVKELIDLLDLKIDFYLVKRIFKASDHNFDVAKFHEICDNVPNTVFIAEINNGNIVGGFTPLTWADEYDKNKTHYKSDHLDKSFLFNFTTKEKYPLIKQNNNKAIMGCRFLGPTFGGGYDFSIGNFANKKYSSSCDFPASYTKNPEVKNDKLNRRSMIGISEEIFLIKQWEIFQLIMKAEDAINFVPKKQVQCKMLSDIQNSHHNRPESGIWKKILDIFINKQK